MAFGKTATAKKEAPAKEQKGADKPAPAKATKPAKAAEPEEAKKKFEISDDELAFYQAKHSFKAKVGNQTKVYEKLTILHLMTTRKAKNGFFDSSHFFVKCFGEAATVAAGLEAMSFVEITGEMRREKDKEGKYELDMFVDFDNGGEIAPVDPEA